MSVWWSSFSQLQLVGTNHKHAPIEVRERLWCQGADLPDRLTSIIQGSRGIKEAVILSTCNRTEIYVVSSDDSNIVDYLTRLMSDWGGIDVAVLRQRIYLLTDDEAVRHLFAVSSGLDSLVIGEKQIQGQVTDAAKVAAQAGTAGEFLSELFRRASRVSKNVRKQNGLELDKASVSSAAVSLLEHASSGRTINSVLLVGAGKMVTLAAQCLAKDTRLDLWIANRTIQRAQEVAKKSGGKPLLLSEVPLVLQTTDAVLTCTSSPSYVIPANDVEAAMSKRSNKPLIIIDIAVPRNVDPEVAKIPKVQLYNIDGLAPFLEKDLASHRPQITKAERQIYAEAKRFLESVRGYDANRTIKELRMMAEQIRGKELSRAMRRLGEVSSRNREIVDVLTRSIINKLLHEPTTRLRQQAAKGNGGLYEATIRELFAICEKSSQ